MHAILCTSFWKNVASKSPASPDSHLKLQFIIICTSLPLLRTIIFCMSAFGGLSSCDQRMNAVSLLLQNVKSTFSREELRQYLFTWAWVFITHKPVSLTTTAHCILNYKKFPSALRFDKINPLFCLDSRFFSPKLVSVWNLRCAVEHRESWASGACPSLLSVVR